ncbi:S41 family peptidase [Paenibacillus sp. FSL R10-2734]|uniref:S41 family peptidase n=1 Tax=Paenibacillus sp. FSL R10-2734 TaxID=2954691 RepID=UPI0030D9AC62
MLFARKSSNATELIMECLKYYEANDIYLNQNNEYLKLRDGLLNSNRIDLNSFKHFVYATRETQFTDFLIGVAHSGSIDTKEQNHFQYRLVNEYLYISLTYFTKKSVDQAIEIMSLYKDRPYLILDLRNSPGGYVDACMSFCRMLIDDKKEIVTLSYKNKKTTYYTDDHALISYKKIYIFVNEHTASCSEISALALKINLQFVRLIGNQTKGKKCGQEIIVNKSSGFSMIIPAFTWKCNEYGIEDLQQLLYYDCDADRRFVTDEDYYSMVFT